MELNLVFGKINFVSPNFILSAFNAWIKNSKCLHFNNIEAYFSNSTNTSYNMSLYKFSRSINSTKVPANLAYEDFIAKHTWLNEARWSKMVISLGVECSLIAMIHYSIHHCDKNTLFRSYWLHKLQIMFIYYMFYYRL